MKQIVNAEVNIEKSCFNAGWAMSDITPERTVAIMGQFCDRFSKGVLDPITVTALAMENIDEHGESLAQSVMVSCDLCDIPAHIQTGVRESINKRLKDFNSRNIFLTATHIHTGPYLERYSGQGIRNYIFDWPDYNKDAMTPEEYSGFLINKISDAIEAAWNGRKKAKVSWQLGHSAIGHNRRVTYDDGTARMYGNTNTVHYRGPEGPEDSGAELLYFWNDQGELTGILINVACPSQVIENLDFISADYWGEVRKKVWSDFGREVCVFAMCGAAGDQSPRDLVRRGRGEQDMRSVKGMAEVADNLFYTIKYKYRDAEGSKAGNPVLKHVVKEIQLPYRSISMRLFEEGKARYNAFIARYNLKEKPLMKETLPFEEQVAFYEASGILARSREKEKSPTYDFESHFIRIGDIAIATNPFELFTVYGLMIKARSKAVQTFIAQLSCDDGGYLATSQAIEGGHYSTTIASGKVGPEGGQMLVEYSVKYINELWD